MGEKPEIETSEALRFADESDRAAAITSQSNDDAVKRHLLGLEKSPPDFDGVHCYDCDEVLQEYRLKIPSFRCVECQSIHEQRQAQTRKFFRGE